MNAISRLTNEKKKAATKVLLVEPADALIKPLKNGNYKLSLNGNGVGIYFSEERAKDALANFVRMGLCKT